MNVKIAGKNVTWDVGEAIFIPRGVDHEITNARKTPVELVSIRIP